MALTLGPAGIPFGNPDARENRGCNDSRQLARDFTPSTERSPELQHEPMSINVLDGVALTQDMCSRQMMKG